jgi:hypothetical protein
MTADLFLVTVAADSRKLRVLHLRIGTWKGNAAEKLEHLRTMAWLSAEKRDHLGTVTLMNMRKVHLRSVALLNVEKKMHPCTVAYWNA